MKVFNIIKGFNESRTLIKHISCKWRCKCDGKKWNSQQEWNNDNCQCECKKPIYYRLYEEVMLGILAYILASVIKVVRLANNWKVAPAENVTLMIY